MGGVETVRIVQNLFKKMTNGVSICESHLQLAINKESGIEGAFTEVLKFQSSDLAYFV